MVVKAWSLSCSARYYYYGKSLDVPYLLPKPRTSFYVHLIARLPASYAATGNRTHVSSVAPLLRDLNPGRLTALRKSSELNLF